MNVHVFKNSINESILSLFNESSGSLGSSEYKIPKDDKTLMADFYAIQHLLSIKDNPKYSKELKFDLQHALSELCYFLKDRLLDFGLYAILSEGTHCFDYLWLSKNNIDNEIIIKDYMKDPNIGGLSAKLTDQLRKWCHNSNFYSFGIKGDEDDKGKRSRERLLKFVQESDRPYDIVYGLRNMFKYSSSWSRQYGGEAWVQCCDAWLNLYNSNGLGLKPESSVSIPEAIDTIFSTEHNTGSFLNKNEEYSSEYGRWVQALLDLKKTSKITNLLPLSSSYVRSLAKKMSYVDNGISANYENDHDTIESMKKFKWQYSYDTTGDARSAFEISLKNITNDIRNGKPFSPSPLYEEDIATDAHYSYLYALKVIKEFTGKNRWPDGEPAILTSGNNIVNYAINVMESRWPEGEHKLLEPFKKGKYSQDMADVFEYASGVIGGRWPEFERIVLDADLPAMLLTYIAHRYVSFVIKGRWPEVEPLLKDQKLINMYNNAVQRAQEK